MANKLQQDAARQRETRRSSTIVEVPKCKDKRRRKRLENDDVKWLRWYFAEGVCEDPFSYAFTGQQVEMIDAIRHAITYGGDQALAASRGEGKTTLFERMLLKYTLQGVIAFSVLFAATGEHASGSLESIKAAIEENERLHDDYPEVCAPVRGLEYAPQRAGRQLVTGWRHDNNRRYVETRSHFRWCGNEIVFPRVPGSPSAGAIIATRGLDSAVRGLKKRGRRPQVAGIDDPDTEDTVRSEEQAEKLERRIDRAIAGLGSQRKTIARVMLTTLQNRTCVSFKYTDPTAKPTWKGKRFRFLVQPPDRMDLWDEYVQLVQADQQQGDEFARRAHAFFLDRYEEMTAGAVVANENRFDDERLPDGTQREVCALQHYFNEVARIGPEAVATEYDNDPAEESGPIESGITAYRIQRQLSGYDKKDIPPGCVAITQGIDCRKVALHWVVRAWQHDGTGYTIDYGIQEVHGTQRGSDEGLDLALRRAIVDRMEAFSEQPYGGAETSLTLVDAGWRTEAVYQACRDVGLGIMPAMGFGRSAGCAGANFSEQQRVTRDRSPGDGWFLSRKGDLWLVAMDADRWKAWEHDRWMTDPGHIGCMQMFGYPSEVHGRMSADEKGHFSYAKHITAEVEVEELYKGALRRRWKNKSDNNHYLDASYEANVAASICGVRLMKSIEAQQQRLQPVEHDQQEAPSGGRLATVGYAGAERDRW